MSVLVGMNALITGGSRGIGYAIAKQFSQQGANVFLAARRPNGLRQAADALRSYGTKFEICTVDVGGRASVLHMVNRALTAFGHIDILVNNAGTNKAARFVESPPELFDEITKVNLYGVFSVTQEFLPSMIARGKGKVFSISSTAGRNESRNIVPDGAAETGVVGWTRHLALEMAPYKINVNAIRPGSAETEVVAPMREQHAAAAGISQDEYYQQTLGRIPLRRYLQPEEVANLALYLASPRSDGMTGQSLAIDGGMTML